jgi:hypothetical protein
MCRRNGGYIVFGLLVVSLAATCGGGQTEVTPATDRVATEVAVQKAAAATLTTEASQAQAIVPSAPAPTATAVPPTVPPPTDTAPPPAAPTAAVTDTPARVPPSATPSIAAPVPTPTPPRFAAVPPDGGRSNLTGLIILPGFAPDSVENPVTFRDWLVFRVLAYDPRVGMSDGAGIDTVRITIRQDGDSDPVYEKLEERPAFCVFGGGEPDCAVLNFARNQYRWPGSNQPIRDGNHQVDILLTTDYGEQEQWIWSFNIELPPINMQFVQTAPGGTPYTVRDALVFQIAADATGGNRDGRGISHVDMVILQDGGSAVHSRTEENAKYCAFGGGEPDCNVYRFADNDWRWPNGDEITPGRYRLQAVAHAEDGRQQILSSEIEIER